MAELAPAAYANISAGKIMLGIKAFNKYQQDFANADFQLEMVTIYMTEGKDLYHLKEDSFMEERKMQIFAELDSEKYEEVLANFPLVVAKQFLRSLGLKPEQIEARLKFAQEEVAQVQASILSKLEESSPLTPEPLNLDSKSPLTSSSKSSKRTSKKSLQTLTSEL